MRLSVYRVLASVKLVKFIGFAESLIEANGVAQEHMDGDTGHDVPVDDWCVYIAFENDWDARHCYVENLADDMVEGTFGGFFRTYSHLMPNFQEWT